MKYVSGFLGLLVALSTSAFADYSGNITVKTSGARGEQTMHGKVFAKPSDKKIRMDLDMPSGGNMSNLIDLRTRKYYSILHAQRMIMEVDPAQMQQDRSAECLAASNQEQCLTSMGFRKTGSESVNGFDCNVFEKDQSSNGRTMHVTMYHPKDRNEAPAVRMIVQTQGEGGMRSQTDITELSFGAVPSNKFDLPAGYARQNANSFMGRPDSSGHAQPDRAALERMMRERMGNRRHH